MNQASLWVLLKSGSELDALDILHTRNRFRIAVLIYSMTNAVIFGAGIITVLNVSALRDNAYFWIPVVVLASLILGAPFA